MFSGTQPKARFTSDTGRNIQDILANFSECNFPYEAQGRQMNEQEKQQGMSLGIKLFTGFYY